MLRKKDITSRPAKEKKLIAKGRPGGEPTEDVPHRLSRAAAQLLGRRFLQDLQQTVDQIQVAHVARVAPPVGPSVDRHPVNQSRVVGRFSPHV